MIGFFWGLGVAALWYDHNGLAFTFGYCALMAHLADMFPWWD